MRITHPVAPYQGFQPEDVFFVSDTNMTQLGTGYLIRFEQKSMYPERPVHYYISIEAQPQARNMLFGALFARAEQLKAANPSVPARLYACVAPEDTEMLHFYEECGLVADDAEDVVRFEPVQGDSRAPIGMNYGSVPLADPTSRAAFLQRVNAHCIQPFEEDYLTLWQQQPLFMALGYYRGQIPVTETVLTGAGDSATLLNIYTHIDYRRQHMAGQLLNAACSILSARGVKTVYAHVFRRNRPQVALMDKLNANYVKTVNIMPGINM